MERYATCITIRNVYAMKLAFEDQGQGRAQPNHCILTDSNMTACLNSVVRAAELIGADEVCER